MTPSSAIPPQSGVVTIRPVSGQVADGAALQGTAARLSPGAVIQGVVSGMNREGDPLVKTDAGDFILKLPIHLRSGLEVVLRMENTQGVFRARLMSVDGVKFADYLQSHSPAQISSETGLPLTNSSTAVQHIADLLPEDMLNLSNTASQRLSNLSQLLQSQPEVLATLLSRSPMIAEVLRQLPQSFQQPARLQTGDQFIFKLLGFSPPSAPSAPSPTAVSTLTSTMPNTHAFDSETPELSNLQTSSASNTRAIPSPTSTPTVTPTSTPASSTNILNELANLTNQAWRANPSNPSNQALPSTGTPQQLQSASLSISNVVAHLAAQEIDLADPFLPASSASAPPSESTVKHAIPSLSTPNIEISADGKILVQANLLDVDSSGDWLVQTPFGTSRLPPPAGLPTPPAGHHLQLQLEAIRSVAQPFASMPLNASTNPIEDGMSFLALTEQWKALEDVLAMLQTHGSSASLLQDMIPQAGPKLTTQMLFFLQALKRDDVAQWINQQTIQFLEQRNRSDLIQRLQKDFSKLRDALEMPENRSPWQAMIFPFQHDQAMHMLRLFVHRDQHQEKQDGNGVVNEGKPWKDTRFVLELELSHLGPIQLNGLVRRQASIHFDLVVRSLKNLSPETQQDIRTIFENAASVTGYQGQILFEVDKHFPDRPLERMIDPPADLTA